MMEKWILIGYEWITVMLPALIFTAIFYLSKKNQDQKAAAWHSLFLLVFAFYLFGVFHYTGSGTVFDIRQYGLPPRADEINLVPFSAASIDLTGYGLNVLLFVPLGFLLPFLWESYDSLARAGAAGFLLSLLVEVSQLLNIRATDVDDLILNTLGTVFGLLFFRLYLRIIKLTARVPGSDRCRSKAFGFVALLFVFRFFTYYGFGMAKLLYHF